MSGKSKIELYLIEKVKEKRIEAGISQATLAREMDVSVGFIGHVESPKHRAKYNLNHINKIAEIFDCRFQDFFPEKAI